MKPIGAACTKDFIQSRRVHAPKLTHDLLTIFCGVSRYLRGHFACLSCIQTLSDEVSQYVFTSLLPSKS